jgi:vacuolar protein sorting-associated protein 35
MTNMDQDAIMDNVSTKIKNSGIAMRKSLETNDLKAALKHAKAMLAELRTNQVTPRNYYNLCISLTRYASV